MSFCWQWWLLVIRIGNYFWFEIVFVPGLNVDLVFDELSRVTSLFEGTDNFVVVLVLISRREKTKLYSSGG